jgi:hypothetical protein
MMVEKLPKFDDAVTFVMNFNGGSDSYNFHGLKFPVAITWGNFVKMRRSARSKNFIVDGNFAYFTLEFSNKDHAEEFWEEYVALMEKV